jgi:RNA polymerase sigma factor (sigma-70 family)
MTAKRPANILTILTAGDADMDAIDQTTLRVREAAAGESAGLEWLVARFSALLTLQVRHRLGPELRRIYDPEDIVQEVWAIALRRLEELQPREGRMTPVVLRFLSTTALHLVSNLLRKHIRHSAQDGAKEIGAAFSQLPAPTSVAIGRALRAEREESLHQAIEELDELDRQIVILRGIEQNSVQDVGIILVIKPNTVTVRYRRALDKLREKLPDSVFGEMED